MEDHTSAIYGAVSVTLVVATVSVIMRLIARRMTKAGYGYEDTLAMIAFVGLLPCRAMLHLADNLIGHRHSLLCCSANMCALHHLLLKASKRADAHRDCELLSRKENGGWPKRTHYHDDP